MILEDIKPPRRISEDIKPPRRIKFFRDLFLVVMLAIGSFTLGYNITEAAITLDSTSITTDSTINLKGGNVGIGTTSPTSNLHVSGTLAVTATSTFSGAVTLSNPSINSLIYTNSTGVIAAFASSTAGKILTATGTAPYFSWEANTATGVSGLTAGGVTFGNSAGNLAQSSTVFYWDNVNGRLGIGTGSPANGLLTVGTNTTASSSGTYFGTDTNLYRSAVNTLKTDGFLSLGGHAADTVSFETYGAGFRLIDSLGDGSIVVDTGNIGRHGLRTGYAIGNTDQLPTSNPVGGGFLYSDAGALKWRSPGGTVTTIAAADYSEDLPAKDDVGHGDLVSLSDNPNPKSDDPTAPFLLQKSQEPYDQKLMGIVSSFSGDTKTYGFYQPIALVGRVPAKVSTENGLISKGDPITSSSLPGVGMRATKQGRIIGIALESYNGSGVGKIMVFVNRTWYLPKEAKQDAKISQEEKGNLEPLLKAPAGLLEKLPDFVRNAGLEIKDKVVTFKELFIEKLSALEILTDKLKAKDVETETIQIKDRATGEPYCTWIENGVWQINRGECSNLPSSTSLSLSTATSTSPSSVIIELQPLPKPGRGGRVEGLAPSSTPGVGSPPATPPGQEKKNDKEKKDKSQSQSSEQQPQQQSAGSFESNTSTPTTQPQQTESLLGSILKAIQNLFRR